MSRAPRSRRRLKGRGGGRGARPPGRDPDRREGPFLQTSGPGSQRLGGSRSPGERTSWPRVQCQLPGPGRVPGDQSPLHEAGLTNVPPPGDSGLRAQAPLVPAPRGLSPALPWVPSLSRRARGRGGVPGPAMPSWAAWDRSYGPMSRLGIREKVARGRAHVSEPVFAGLWEDSDRTRRRRWVWPPVPGDTWGGGPARSVGLSRAPDRPGHLHLRQGTASGRQQATSSPVPPSLGAPVGGPACVRRARRL